MTLLGRQNSTVIDTLSDHGLIPGVQCVNRDAGLMGLANMRRALHAALPDDLS
jgi:hypothetical protein